MYAHRPGRIPAAGIRVTEEVTSYIRKRGCDFRICTSCGGPILLPVAMKRPKPTDLVVPVGDYKIFVSAHQSWNLPVIHMGLVPVFFNREEDSSEDT